MTGAGVTNVGARGRSVAVVYAAILLLVVGSALPVPLLPLYGEQLALPPDRVALVFSSYLATMVLALGFCSIPAAQARPRLNLMVALALAMAADVLFLVGTEPALLAARVLTGFSVGFGLGAGATLSVRLRGDHGRSVAATMTMVAGFIGILGSALVADLTPWPTTAPFVGHLVLAGIVLILFCRASISAPVPHPEIQTSTLDVEQSPAPSIPPTRTAVVTGAAVGVLAWSLGNVAVGLGPTLIRGSLTTESLLATSLVAVLVAGFGIAGQYSVPTTRFRFAVTAATASLVAGAVLFGVGTALTNVAVVVAGGALIGLGQGSGYRMGMLAVTRGLSPQRHGARTSLYACAAYLAASACVQVGGVLMASSGSHSGLLILLSGFILPLMLLLAACLRWRPWALPSSR